MCHFCLSSLVPDDTTEEVLINSGWVVLKIKDTQFMEVIIDILFLLKYMVLKVSMTFFFRTFFIKPNLYDEKKNRKYLLYLKSNYII